MAGLIVPIPKTLRQRRQAVRQLQRGIRDAEREADLLEQVSARLASNAEAIAQRHADDAMQAGLHTITILDDGRAAWAFCSCQKGGRDDDGMLWDFHIWDYPPTTSLRYLLEEQLPLHVLQTARAELRAQ
jgi:hypothetical protein